MTDEQSGASVFAKQGTVTLLGNLAGIALKFAFFVVLARLLTKSKFGTYTLALSVVLFVSELSNLSVYRGIDYFVPEMLDDGRPGRAYSVVRRAVLVSIPASAAFVVALVAATGPLAAAFDDPSLTVVLPVLLLSLPLMAVEKAVAATFTSIKVLKYRMLVQRVLKPGTRIAFVAGVLLLGGSFGDIAVAHVVALALTVAVGVALVYRTVPWVGASGGTPIRYRSLLEYTLPLALAGAVYAFVSQLDYFVIGYFASSEDVGIYRVAYLVAANVLVFHTAITPVFKPMASEVQGDAGVLGQRYRLAARWVVLLTTPVVTTLLLVPETYIALLFTERFAVAALPLSILVVGFLANVAVGPGGRALEGTGFSRLKLLNTVLVVVVNGTLDVLLVPVYGITGAAIATATAFGVASVVVILELYHFVGIVPVSWGVVKPLASGAVAYGVARLLVGVVETPLVLAVVVPVVVLLVYGIVVLVVDPFTEDDRQLYHRVVANVSDRL
jgi:stage V sporulation protein B